MFASRKTKSRFAVWLLLLLVSAAAGRRADAQAASGYSEYYIPGPEGNNSGTATELGMWWIFDDLDDANAGGDTTMHSVITVTAWAPNVTIYYDHWENGLAFDPNNPTTADESYTLAAAGSQRIFESSNIPTTPRGTTTFYDGGDRLYIAGGTVTVSRASWIEGVGAGNQAVAWEIYPVKPQLTTYVLPFGENLTAFTPFQRVYVLIQATADGTTFTVDLDGDGNPDALNQNHDGDRTDAGDTATVTLQAGRTFLLDRVSACRNGGTSCTTNPGTLDAGTTIQGSSTLQVKFVAGDPGRNYCARGLSAFPRGYWTKDYYAPLDQPASAGYDTDYYLHNPHSTEITVQWESRTSNGSFPIPARSTVSFRATEGSVPTDSGLYFRGTDDFWGVGINDSGDVTNGATFEWGFSLLPSTFLYSEHYLGWAPGYASWFGGDATNRDDVGVFLTAAQDNTVVFVDTNSDGTAEQTYTLDRLQTQFIWDQVDGDLSRAHIWATGLFTMAYGENGDTAGTSNPSLDLGYVAIPGTDFISLVLGVAKSASPQIVPTASGSTTTFTIVGSTKQYPLDGASIVDTLPPSWEFVPNSAVITRPDLSTVSGASANPAITGAGTLASPYVLTWSAAQLDPSGMAPNQQVIVSFGARTTAVLAAGTLSQNRVVATGTRTIGSPAVTQTFSATDFAFVASGSLQITKTSNAPTPLYPGDAFGYTVTVTNPAGAPTQTGVSLYDTLPAGVTAVVGSVSLNRSSVADGFDLAAYGNSSGTRSWSSNWTESGDDASATRGAIVVTGGQLRLGKTLNVADAFETVAYSNQDGTANWSSDWSETDSGGGGAGAGRIFIANGQLNIRNRDSVANFGQNVFRGVNLTGTGATQAVLTFDYTTSGNLEVGDDIVVQYRIGGGAWTTFTGGTFTDDVTGTASLPIPIANPANLTEIRFAFPAAGDYDGNNEAFYVDNLSVAYNTSVTPAVSRGVNLTGTGATQAVLAFDYATSGNLEATDDFVVQYQVGGGGWTTPAGGTFVDDVAGTASFSIPLASPANLTEVRFSFLSAADYADLNEFLTIDNLSITYNQSVVADEPPGMLARSALYALVGGQALTATLNVTVDDPFPAGSTSITNTAATTSRELPIQLTASVTNQVTVPTAQSATIAGRVWFDADAGADQDVGEPGLGNVQVTLKDQFGTPVATLTTDSNGRYLFTGVPPGNGYYVEVAGGLPGGVVQSFPIGRTDNRTGSFNLTSGQNYTGADLGYRPAAGTATFGDLAWVDADGDQLKDPGEVGLGGVRVRLYRDANSNGFLEPGTDALVGVPAAGPGTVIVTNGSATVTGVGTQFLTLAPNDPITIGGVVYTIQTIASNTQLTLSATYAGTSGSLKPYTATTAQGPGTIQVTNGSTTVTGTGTAFTSLEPGDPIVIRGEKYVVATRTSDTALTLTASFTGTSGSGVAYGVANPTYTAADGSYLITGIPATGSQTYFVSAIGPAGYTSTTGGASRFQNVASGAVLLTADFGFRNDTGTFSISDRVWNDADGDMDFDGGSAEPGIGGVTVDLLDASLNVVGTTTTAADGTFTFSGLAGGGADYTIRLSDASGVLANYSGTTPYATARERAEPNLTASVDRRPAAPWPTGPSFGFLATRSIGDSVYIDANGNGTQDSGENGLPGVAVSLYRDVDGDGTLSLVAAANVTATNGSTTVTGTGFLNYHAGEPVMIGGALYTIQSVTNNTTLVLTSPFSGTTGSNAFRAPEPGPGTVSVTNGSPTVTGSGFSRYRAGEPITINDGGTTNVVYTILSVNSDTSLTLTTNYAGTTNGARTYYGPGDALVSTVTTGSTGQYLFAGLPARDYVVSATGPAGYDYIPGTRPDSDTTTPGVQLAATVSGSGNVLDRDFGFQAPAAGGIQGTLWNDADGDGVIDGSETGRYAGVTVEVRSGGSTGPVVATLTTDANGNYSVAGLAVGSYTVRVTDVAGVLTGITATTGTSRSVTVVANTNATADFGFRPPTPTYAAVSSLKAWTAGGEVVVEWRTTLEVGTVGFDLYRLDREERVWVKANESLLPALPGHPGGGTYTFVDEGAPASGPLAYKLVEVDARADRRDYGPWRFQGLQSGPRAAEPFLRTPSEVPPAERERLTLLSREREAALAAQSGQKGERVKATTREAGLHFVDGALLANLLGEKLPSLESRISSGRMAVENLGAPVAWAPAPAGLGIYFYAEKLDDPYTDANAYWISARRGTTMGSVSGDPTFAGPAAAFTETVHAEVDRFPLPTFFHDPEADFYAWDYLYAGYPGDDERTFTTTLRGVAGAGAASLTVRLQGGSDTAAPNEHRVRVRWNGSDLGEATWDGITPWAATFPLGPTDVVEGTNTLVVTAILEPGLEYDVVFVDSFDVSYPRLYRAEDDELRFTVAAGAEAAVSGFTTPGAVLLDVTEPATPLLVSGASPFAPGDGSYGLRFANRTASERSYLAVAPARAKAPAALTAGRPFRLADAANGADYLLVAPPSLAAAAESLAAYRRARGIDTMVVALEDVYDEFGWGLATPLALKDFLAHASASWSRPPQYVTLVGRGTFDYKDAQGVGDNLTPTLLAGTPYGLVASDVSYAPLSSTAARALKGIGRLPVLTSQELLDYLAKVQVHESAPPASWQSQLLLTADDADVGGAFPADSDAIGEIAPASFLKTKVYLGPYTVPDARAAILGTFNAGALLFNFIGHGSPDRLAAEGILAKTDVPSMTNAGRLPVFLAMTCSAGNFAIPGFPSLSESLVLWKSGGAYAAWAPSGLSLNDGARTMNEAFFQSAFQEGEKVVGRSCTRSLEALPPAGPYAFMKSIYNLIGEPVSRLP